MTYKPDSDRMLKTLRYLREVGETGGTWGEIGSEFGWHHGKVSSVLSTLHKEGRISRLKEKRGKSYVYVDNEFVNERETGSYGVAHKAAGMTKNAALDQALYNAELVRRGVRTTRILTHNKQCWRDHPDCAIKVVMNQIQLLKDAP